MAKVAFTMQQIQRLELIQQLHHGLLTNALAPAVPQDGAMLARNPSAVDRAGRQDTLRRSHRRRSDSSSC